MNSVRTILVCLIAATASGPASADSVRLRGSAITLDDCRILSIKGGELVFSAPGGRRMQKHLEDVIALGFAGIEEIDHAESSMLEQDYDRAVKWFVLALAKSQSDLQRQWIHVRLARAHDKLGQYVQSAGHAAAVFVFEDHPAWKRLVPMCEPDRPAYPAAKEAHDHLQAARRSVQSAELVHLVTTMLGRVKPAYDEAARAYQGPRLKAGDTISGYALGQLDKVRASLIDPDESGPLVFAVGDDEANESTMPEDPASAEEAQDEPAPEPQRVMTTHGTDIAILIDQERYQMARSRCERELPDANPVEVAELRYWLGLALKGLDQPRDAAVEFMRSYILQPDSAQAAACLLETAEIYETTFLRVGKAVTLMRMALVRAENRGDDMIADRARAMLNRLGMDPAS